MEWRKVLLRTKKDKKELKQEDSTKSKREKKQEGGANTSSNENRNEKKTHSPSMPTFDLGVEFPPTPPAPPTPLTTMTLDSIDVLTQQVLGSKIPCLNQTTDVPIEVSELIVEELVLDANMIEKLYEWVMDKRKDEEKIVETFSG
ncbi:uncharacterized protein DS421_11g341760 [Arachis hypogaea]|nr:uncharacterized protein DS421_11g341760 [Arachis hypogaea]